MTLQETRATRARVEFRAADAGKVGALSGYAIMWNRYSQNLGGFVEQVDPRAADKSLADGLDVLCRYQHDDQHLLGRTASGTLTLEKDGTGLRYDVPELPDTTSGRDVAELARRGDVTHSSFAFQTLEDDWSLTDQGFPLRTLLAVRLVDVAPVVSPAYLDTTAAVRSLAEHVHADPEDVLALAARGEIAQRLKVPTVIDLQTPDQDGQRATHPRTSVLLRLVELERKRTT